MALNTTGQLSLAGSTVGQSVDLELGQTATTTISFNDTNVRTLTGTAAGTQLTLPTNFYGKARRFPFNIVISAATNNYLAATSKVSGYVAGLSDVTFTINSGVIVGSASIGSYAFTVDTSWASGDTVTIVNGGQILGAGGPGAGYGGTGNSGGPAVSVGRTTTFTNNGTVGGGGGGGGTSGQYNTGGRNPVVYGYNGGGGGQGSVGGAGGPGEAVAKGVNYAGSTGNAGTSSAPGTGNTNAQPGGIYYGGTGGTLGAAGGAGGGAGSGAQPGGAALTGKTFVNAGVGITGTVYGGQS